MLILDDNNEPIILDSIYTPTITDHFWVLDLNLMDFKLAPLYILEEIICPSVTVKISGFVFTLPANWNMLVFSEETHQVDVVEISQLAGREFTAMICGYKMPSATPGKVTVIDYIPDYKNVSPALNKHQMLCHPISPTAWVNITPSDVYNKYLKDLTVGNIIG